MSYVYVCVCVCVCVCDWLSEGKQFRNSCSDVTQIKIQLFWFAFKSRDEAYVNDYYRAS
jgi:hypothetical protein